MLNRSWVVFKGVGEVTELKLWSEGLHDWTDESCFERACGLFPKLNQQRELRLKALSAIEKKDHLVLSTVLPRSEHWRLWKQFSEDALYLDIETTGLGPWAEITVLGTYYRGSFRAFVNGKDLEQAWDYINKASMVVTFNGRQFDVPFIERHFAANLVLPHIDLRFVAASLGYKGGLKKIEPQFGIERTGDIKSVDGYQAVVLWKRYKRGDLSALQTLIEYNQADVEGLPVIMQGCWERKVDGIRD